MVTEYTTEATWVGQVTQSGVKKIPLEYALVNLSVAYRLQKESRVTIVLGLGSWCVIPARPVHSVANYMPVEHMYLGLSLSIDS